jgi:DNA excision repair protein ERCC-2
MLRELPPRGSMMSNFCETCGSLLVWDFSDGSKRRRCPRCKKDVEVEGSTKDLGKPYYRREGGQTQTNQDPNKYRIKKGVSSRSSNYASTSIYKGASRSFERPTLSEVVGKGTKKDIVKGDPAPSVFPFDTIRMGQKEFMEDTARIVKEEGFLLANVPTGIGKTAAAISPAVEYALKDHKMVLFMTSKQSQHKIAVETLKGLRERTGKKIKVADVVSKQSMCPRDLSKLPHASFSFLCKEQSKDGSCPLFKPPPKSLTKTILEDIHDVNEIQELSMRWKICPHRAVLEAAKEADVLICDFNYLFSDLSDTILSGLGRDLSELVLIVDEAHNLPDRIRSNQSEELPLRLVDDARDMISGNRHLKVFLREIKELILREAKHKKVEDGGEVKLDKREFISELRAIFQSSIDGSFDLEIFIEMLEDFSKKRRGSEEENPVTLVAEFLNKMLSMKKSHILYIMVPEGKSIDSLKLAFRNLDPGEISGPIFKGCHSAILMSGTLSPPSMFGDILGMKRSRREEKVYPSPFPRRNKLVLLEEKVTTAYKKRSSSMYRTIAERIVSMTGSFPGNVAAFFPSYSMLFDVKEYLWGCPKRTIVEERSMTRSDKENLITELMRAKGMGGALLLGAMGGSLSEGVDYKDNLLTGVFVIGLPFAPPSLEVLALRDYFKGKFGYVLGEEYSYIYPAMNKILQASGRSIRSESDRAVVVLMDERLKEPRYLKFLPEEMRPAILDGKSLESAISEFF